MREKSIVQSEHLHFFVFGSLKIWFYVFCLGRRSHQVCLICHFGEVLELFMKVIIFKLNSILMYILLSKFPATVFVRLPGLTGGPDLSFGFPWNGKIPHPHQAAWSQPINRRPKGNKGNMRESGKARKRLSLNKSPRKFVPIKLLCKHVTNPLKPATNCLCSPYKFM